MQSQTVVTGSNIATQPANSRNQNTHIQSQAISGLSITQIVIGGICIIASVVALAAGCDRDQAKDSGCGIWSGIVYIITGIIGVLAAKSKTNGSIVAFMVMCIIAAVLCIFTLSFGAASVSQARDEIYDIVFEEEECEGDDKGVSIAMGTILIIAALAEAVVAITASGISCGAVCCAPSSPGSVYIPTQTVMTSGTTTYMGPGGSHVIIQSNNAPGYPVPVNPGYGYPQPAAYPQQYPPPAGPVMPPPYNEPTAQADVTKPPPYNPNV